jgi:Flp pilus assembly protein TadG
MVMARESCSPFKRIAKDKRGATALEFGFVAAPFFWILMGMAELGAMSLVQSNLDNAIAEVGRRIRTGEVQTTGISAAELKNALCDEVTAVMSLNCGAYLRLDVDQFDSFADVGAGPPVTGGAFDESQIGFEPGVASEVILVRVYYQWDIFTPMFENIFANMGGGTRLVASSMLFRNEPF